ncbi:unnamed protein product, partial [Protopolystoma xenopodis]
MTGLQQTLAHPASKTVGAVEANCSPSQAWTPVPPMQALCLAPGLPEDWRAPVKLEPVEMAEA